MMAGVPNLLHAEQIDTPQLCLASPSARRVQCATAAGAGAVEVGLPGPPDGSVLLARLDAKRKSRLS
jgi:hypothetical protein